MRVPGPEGRWAPKQLTLCYTDTAGEAAVGRYLATLWSWHQVVVAGGGAPQLPRLNFPLARWARCMVAARGC